MKRSIWFCILAVVVLSAAHGCIFSPDTTKPPEPPKNYRPQTSPENVLWNLQVAYRRYRSDGIDNYAKLLHPDFLFYFQPNDARDLGQDYWNRDRDSLQTAGLFNADKVQKITIDLILGPTQPVRDGSDTLTIRVNPTYLDVDELETDGTTTTWRVSGDIQDMFFVRSESDTSIWEIVEWRDIDGGSGSTGLLETASDESPVDSARRIRNVSWGELREHLAESRRLQP